jgi:hypothetical protein
MPKQIDPAVQEALETNTAKLAIVHGKAVAKLVKEHEKALVTQKKELIAKAKAVVSHDETTEKTIKNAILAHHKNVLAALAA